MREYQRNKRRNEDGQDVPQQVEEISPSGNKRQIGYNQQQQMLPDNYIVDENGTVISPS